MGLRHLRYATEDAEAADDRFVEEASNRSATAREGRLQEIVESHDDFAKFGARRIYHLGLVYTMARRVLDLASVVADTALPRTEAQLSRSVHKLRQTLGPRCKELGIDQPTELIDQADVLIERIKNPRDDYTEHPNKPGVFWSIGYSTEEGALALRNQEQDGSSGHQFGHPREIAEMTRAYVGAMLDFLGENLPAHD